MQNARVIQRGIQRDGLGTEIQHAQGIHADLHERMALLRQQDLQTAEDTIRTGLGQFDEQARSSVSRVGEPQRSWTIGPTTWRPAVGGKHAAQVAEDLGAFRSGSGGNNTEFKVPVLSPSRSTSVRTVRCRATNPPMPVRVKPRPSRNRREAFGGEDHDQRIAAAAIGHPSGEQAQGLEGARVSASSSRNIPLYSARWGSKPRKPPR